MAIYKNTNKYLLYLFIFFHSLIPAYTIERLFWQERGMNIQMVVWCEIIYAVTIICAEFPSGLLADRFGRKSLIVISSVFSLLEIIIITFANNFWHFAIAVLLAGIGTALSSGAYNALLYDSLASVNHVDKFEQTLGKINAIDFTAGIIAALSGGVLASRFGLSITYYISIISYAITVVVAFFLREPPRESITENPSSLVNIIKTTMIFLKSNIKVLKILLNAVIIAACVTYVYEFWQLYIEGFSFPVAFYGVVSASLSIVVIPASLLSGVVLKRLKHEQIILLASFICSIGILFASVVNNITGIIGLALACSANAIIDPVAFGYLHHYADDDARATIESVISLGERFIGIFIGLVFSYISTKLNVNTGFLFLGTLTIIVSVLMMIWRSKE